MSIDNRATETVYLSEDAHVMSERVRALASSVYSEFQKMIERYDEDVVKSLMPIVVGILEGLDQASIEKQERDVEVELLREDNEQLMNQYEREKQLRKSTEQKHLELDDLLEEEKKQSIEKIEMLESNIRMFEIKGKNIHEHVSRLEEKENELKNEYKIMRDRYTELLTTHMDYMEKTKLVMNSEKFVLDSPTIALKKGIFSLPQLRQTNMKFGETKPDGYHHVSRNHNEKDLSFEKNKSISSLKNEIEMKEKLETDTRHIIDYGDSDGDSSEHLKTFRKSDDEMHVLVSSDVLLSGDDLPSISCKENSENKRTSKNSISLDDVSLNDNEIVTDVDEFEMAGMSREVENLILENTELLATKNALNIVKDDLITKVDELTNESEILKEEINVLLSTKERLTKRVIDLETELKIVKDEVEKLKAADAEQDESDLPTAQRKRFTRVEMARVLMERNQYKERLMELQEAVRWTEMIRASKEHPELIGQKQSQEKRSSLWNVFGGLFSSGKSDMKKINLPSATIRYEAPAFVQPVCDVNEAEINTMEDALGEKVKAFDFLREGSSTDFRKSLQPKKLRSFSSKKDDGRIQAYGWSLSNKNLSLNSSSPTHSTSKSNLPVPIPIHCRNLIDGDESIKMLCASAVKIGGGKTRDGGVIIGASIFYHGDNQKQIDDDKEDSNPNVESINKDLKFLRNFEEEEKLCSLVWIATYQDKQSIIRIIDANRPNEILQTFCVSKSSKVFSIASAPGALPTDFKPISKETLKSNTENSSKNVENESVFKDGNFCNISVVQCVICNDSLEMPSNSPDLVPRHSEISNSEFAINRILNLFSESDKETMRGITKEKISSPSNIHSEDTHDLPDNVAEAEAEKLSGLLPTMWLGFENGNICVYSALKNWYKRLYCVKLNEAIIQIIHVRGRIFIALSNGTIAIFQRRLSGFWNMDEYHLLEVSKQNSAIRCLCVVNYGRAVWCGLKNKILVIDSYGFSIITMFDVHPRRESQVRQMVHSGDGVWISIRLDSTLRLFHSHTHQHLQDIDMEPYVEMMLGSGRLGFSFVRVTSLLLAGGRLWVGTGNGVIVSIPITVNQQNKAKGVLTTRDRGPGSIIRFYESSTDVITPSTFLPFCDMSQAQVSFHGHRDRVLFFINVPGQKSTGISAASSPSKTAKQNMLVLSGGEGYIDFRLEDDCEKKNEKSHIVIWQVFQSIKRN